MKSAKTPYGPQFYAALSEITAHSAEACVPRIIRLLHPRSIVDIGCGQGDWLAAFRRHGVEDVLGVDGDHVRRDDLRIPSSLFLAGDLRQPLWLSRRFDVALALEVAEHLPPACASNFVVSLTALAPAVVFSAAVPGQGGVDHFNEQWPWYWKQLFARHGYVQLDPFRRELWQNKGVAFYYQQNMFVYVDSSRHRELIDRIGVPEPLEELTLVRTTTLQELTRPSLASRLIQRFASAMALMLKRDR